MRADLANLLEQVSRQAGCDLSAYDEAFLQRSVDKRMRAAGCQDTAEYGRLLDQGDGEVKELFGALNITYSEFFRDCLAFAVLERSVLPQLVDAGRKKGQTGIRVWSAGCAAGQEAYSIAILLDTLAGEVPFRIFATDREEARLLQARQGLYPVEALGGVRLGLLQTCFTRQGETYRLAERIMPRVDFSTASIV